MSLTRSQTEVELLTRVRGIMGVVPGLDASTSDGSNLDLNGPIRRALGFIGYFAVDVGNVTDTDLASVTGWQVEQLFDVAELRLWENIWGNWPYWKYQISDASASPEQLADRICDRISMLEERIREPYGPNVGSGAVGVIVQDNRPPSDVPVAPLRRWSARQGDYYNGPWGGMWCAS